MHAPTKISQLDSAQTIEEILWLYISVNDVLCMDVLEGFDDLQDVASCLFLGIVATWL